jgi:CrcB protein
MKSLLLVAIGGVAGTLVRFALALSIPDNRVGTLAANLIGVALASSLLVLMERRGVTELRHLLLPGFCAGLTTFSAVTVQVFKPSSGGALFLAENIFLSLLIVVIVLPLSRKLIPVRN